MRITKNTLLMLVFASILLVLMYFYGWSFVDSILKENFNINEFLGIEVSGEILALATFCFGLFIGWLLFRRRI